MFQLRTVHSVLQQSNAFRIQSSAPNTPKLGIRKRVCERFKVSEAADRKRFASAEPDGSKSSLRAREIAICKIKIKFDSVLLKYAFAYV